MILKVLDLIENRLLQPQTSRDKIIHVPTKRLSRFSKVCIVKFSMEG